MEVVLVFFFGFLIDIMYVYWILSVSKGNKIQAGLASIFITAPALFGIYSVIHNVWMSIPYLLGMFSGTITGMIIDEKIKESKDGQQSQQAD